eukprot:TRINITY_DN1758_c1_g1_i1.p1 TRINITY_DN1758_c1_g1~~TRINITY_DN1758_c1_g1_i1.p1  ORF type:complete len:256 (+),score=11.92 TRINITY_DN1758_c1_g1_i1:77-844(+)
MEPVKIFHGAFLLPFICLALSVHPIKVAAVGYFKQEKVNLARFDISIHPRSSVPACVRMCTASTLCKSFAFSSASTCYLKSVAPSSLHPSSYLSSITMYTKTSAPHCGYGICQGINKKVGPVYYISGNPLGTTIDSCSTQIGSSGIRFLPFQTALAPACNLHDVCYRCGVTHSIGKRACDERLRTAGIAICRFEYSLLEGDCITTVNLMVTALLNNVQGKPQRAYDGAIKEPLTRPRLCSGNFGLFTSSPFLLNQ